MSRVAHLPNPAAFLYFNTVLSKKLTIALLLVSWWTCAFSSAWAQTMTPPPLPRGDVVEVRVVGTQRVETRAVMAVIGTHRGQPLDRDQIRQDIEAIRALRRGESSWFDDIQVDVHDGPEGLIVTFELTERPVISSSSVSVQRGELEGEARDLIQIRPGDLFDRGRLDAEVQRIERLYREEGYALAEVNYRWIELEDGSGELRFEIDPNEVVTVGRVAIVGNEAIDDDELRSIMLTQRGGLLAFLTGAGVFDASKLSEDRQRLRTYYYEHGYLDTEVSPIEAELSRDGSEVSLTVSVNEGPQYAIRCLDWGEETEPLGELPESLRRTERGAIFRASTIRRDLEAVERHYHDRGYARARVEVDTTLDADAASVDIGFRLLLGPRVAISRIRIEGNETTRDTVIRRELQIREGDWFDKTAIEESRRRLEALRLFEAVEIREVPTENADTLDLIVNVVEGSRVRWQGRFAYGRISGVTLNGLLATRNLLGRGQTLSGEIDLVYWRPYFAVGFVEPHLAGSDWQLALQAFTREVPYPDFSRVSEGLTIGAGRALPAGLSISALYRLERVRLEARNDQPTPEDRHATLYGSGRTSSLLASFAWDRRDNPYMPTSGFLNSASVEWADDLIGSEEELLGLNFTSRWYYSPLDHLIFKLNASLGHLIATNPEQPIRVFERFFLGGPTSVRGFDSFYLSPSSSVAADSSDPLSPLTPIPEGGDKSFFLNLEVQFPIWTAIGLHGVAFADVGNVFAEGTPFALNLDLFEDNEDRYDRVLRTAAGFGIRWLGSPLGLLRIDVGFPLSPLDGEAGPVFSIGAGTFL